MSVGYTFVVENRVTLSRPHRGQWG